MPLHFLHRHTERTSQVGGRRLPADVGGFLILTTVNLREFVFLLLRSWSIFHVIRLLLIMHSL